MPVRPRAPVLTLLSLVEDRRAGMVFADLIRVGVLLLTALVHTPLSHGKDSRQAVMEPMLLSVSKVVG